MGKAASKGTPGSEDATNEAVLEPLDPTARAEVHALAGHIATLLEQALRHNLAPERVETALHHARTILAKTKGGEPTLT